MSSHHPKRSSRKRKECPFPLLHTHDSGCILQTLYIMGNSTCSLPYAVVLIQFKSTIVPYLLRGGDFYEKD